jgi:hypothetical protein
MKLKYQHEIEGLNLNGLCPTEVIPPLGIEVYRWSYEPVEHHNNFLPNVAFDRAINNPYPYATAKNTDKCKRCAASFFTDMAIAIKKWDGLSGQNKENFGYTHLAKGVLNEKDGVIYEPDKKTGHFGFYEFDDAELVKKFQNIAPLNNAGS